MATLYLWDEWLTTDTWNANLSGPLTVSGGFLVSAIGQGGAYSGILSDMQGKYFTVRVSSSNGGTFSLTYYSNAAWSTGLSTTLVAGVPVTLSILLPSGSPVTRLAMGNITGTQNSFDWAYVGDDPTFSPRVVARLKSDGDFLMAGRLDERSPVITRALTRHFPMDIPSYPISTLKSSKVLAYRISAVSCPLYNWINAACRSFTDSPDLLAVTAEQAKAYDLVIVDGYVWGLTSALMSQLKLFVDAGVAVLATGNDTRTSVFVSSYTAVTQGSHTLNVESDLGFSVPGLQGSAGSGDLIGGIDSLLFGYPVYRRSDSGQITGWIYENKRGYGAMFFDQEGIGSWGPFNPIFEYVLNRSRSPVCSSMTNVTLDERGVSVEEETTNLVPNPDGKLITAGYEVPGTYQPGWNTSLHSQAVLISTWGSGYNGGVANPSVGYHAFWAYDQSIPSRGKRAVLCLYDINTLYGNPRRWLGVAIGIGTPTALGWVAGTVITISFLLRSDTTGKGVRPGIYHRLISTGLMGFESAVANVYPTKVNEWERRSISYTVTSNWDPATSMSLYVYGESSGPEGRAWVTDFQLEKKAFATSFVNGTRAMSYLKYDNVLSPSKGTVLVDVTFHEDNTVYGLEGDDQYGFGNRIAWNAANCWWFHDTDWWWIQGSGGVQASVYLTSPVVREVRTKLAFVYSDTDGTMDVYKNGVLASSGAKQDSIVGLLGSLGTGWTHSGVSDSGSYKMSQTIHSLTFYSDTLTAAEIKTAHGAHLAIRADEVLTEVTERLDLMDVPFVASSGFRSGSMTNPGLSNYNQANCVTSLLAGASRRRNRYGLFIYRPKDLVYPAAGNTMWGGIRLYPSEEAKIPGHSYRISFWAKGQSTAATDSVYIAREIGWGTLGIGLASRGLTRNIQIPANFNSKKWTYFEGAYTVDAGRWMAGRMHMDTTAGSDIVNIGSSSIALSTSTTYLPVGAVISNNPNIPAGTTVAQIISTTQFRISTGVGVLAATNVYSTFSTLFDTYQQIKIGYSYNSTGALGTKVFVDQIRIEDITNETRVAGKLKADRFEIGEAIEGVNRVYVLGSAQLAGDITLDQIREFTLNGVATAPAAGRGLTLMVWTAAGTVTSNTVYDTYLDTATADSLAAALLAVPASRYWALLSYDAVKSSTTLTAWMLKAGAVRFAAYDFTTNFRVPYVAVGKGQLCFKEDLRTYGTDRWYATIEWDY